VADFAADLVFLLVQGSLLVFVMWPPLVLAIARSSIRIGGPAGELGRLLLISPSRTSLLMRRFWLARRALTSSRRGWPLRRCPSPAGAGA